MTKVPFADLKALHEPIRSDLHQAAIRVIDSTHYIGGEDVAGFEREMAQSLGVPEVCSCSCATMGLYSVLKCAGIGPGDQVLTTVHTAIATAEAVTMTGAEVVFCDIDPVYYTIDPREVARKITPKTKAVIPVHLYGQPADLTPILELAKKHNLFLVEDCAQAQGAKYNGRTVGTFGDAAVFSFFPSKTLGGFGDGGAVIVKDPKLSAKVRMFANHGRTSKYLHEFEGTNSRLDAIQAAMLRVCLPCLDDWNKARRTAASWYDKGLAGIKQVKAPRVRPQVEHAYHVYVITVPDRHALQDYLKQHGVDSGIHYPYSLNVLPAYAHLNQPKGSFPHAEHTCEHVLSLPLCPSITPPQVEHVCSLIKEFFTRNP